MFEHSKSPLRLSFCIPLKNVSLIIVVYRFDDFSFIFMPACGGHLVMYYVTKPNGERSLTWGMYIPVPSEEIDVVMTDNGNVRHEYSLAAGTLKPELVDTWKQRATANLPSNYAAIVNASENTFIQGIFDCELPTLASGNVILTGDAGFVARPHTVAGFAKAYENATALIQALQECETVPEALQNVNNSQLPIMQRAVALGLTLGEGTVLDVPTDMSSWSEDYYKNWMKNLTNIDGKLNIFNK